MLTISWIVKGVSGSPREALVVVKRRDDFSIVMSDASTGAYSARNKRCSFAQK